MDVWISGGFALLGALAGVLLTTYLTRSSKRRDAKRARLEEALRCTSAAIAAANFALHVRTDVPPDSVKVTDLEKLDRRLYLANLENYAAALRDARRAIAMLAADGMDIGDSWRTEQHFQGDMEAIHSRLRSLLAAA